MIILHVASNHFNYRWFLLCICHFLFVYIGIKFIIKKHSTKDCWTWISSLCKPTWICHCSTISR